MLPTDKRANISSGLTKIVIGVVVFFIGLVLVVLLSAAFFPELLLAFGNLSNTSGGTIPLSGLFSPQGILMLIIVVVVFIALLVIAFKLPSMASGRR